MAKQDNQKEKKKGGNRFFSEFTGAISDVVNEVKADIASMTPPSKEDQRRREAQKAAEDRASSLAGEGTRGLYEEYDNSLKENDSPSSGQEKKPLGTALPPNPWHALGNADETVLMHADACFHALTPTDIKNYRRALHAEKMPPYTLAVMAVNIQAPVEGEAIGEEGEGTPLHSDDLLYTSLIEALEEPRIYGAVGAGPRQLWSNLQQLDDRLTAMLNDNPKIIALGPIGIDEPYAPYQLEAQKAQFALQLEIAADFNLPAIINHRDSVPHVVEILARMNPRNLPPLIWLDVLDTEDEAYIVRRFNMYGLLRPEITVPDFIGGSYYRTMPEERLLLASGSALVAPHGFSGHFNQPRFLQNTLASSCKMLTLNNNTLTGITNGNLAKLFGQYQAAAQPQQDELVEGEIMPEAEIVEPPKSSMATEAGEPELDMDDDSPQT